MTLFRRVLPELTIQDEYRLSQRLKRLAEGDEKGRERLDRDIAKAAARLEQRRAAVPAVSYPEELPVSRAARGPARRDPRPPGRDRRRRDRLGQDDAAAQDLPGAGPRACAGAIAHTQPRRLAARTVAERIADELKVPLGAAVGYAVRFTDKSGENTLLRLMTDGLLLAEIQNDRLLRRYDTIIVDEAHERSPEHRLPARLPQADPARGGRT